MPAPIRPIVAAMLVPLLLGGCGLPSFMTFPPQVRGNIVASEQLKELTPGTSTRNDVSSLLGSPSAKAPFDDNTWIYIGEVTKPVIGGTQEVLTQDVTVLAFDSSGVLRTVDHRTGRDSLPVDVVARSTPSPGSDASVLQQLLGNIGKFTPGGGVGTGGGSGGSGTNRSGN